MSEAGMTAWVAGATGLIGKQLVQILVADPRYTKVCALVREPKTDFFPESDKLSQVTLQWHNLIASRELNEPVDAVFCALGSTKKKTPDPREYFRIDVQYPIDIAQAGLKAGAKFFGLVSADGANPKSLFSYVKMKGELERQLRTLDYQSVAIARPSLLLGDRDEYRLGEKLGEKALQYFPGNFKAIRDVDVAASLVIKSHNLLPGVSTMPSASMQGAMQTLAPSLQNIA